MLLEVNQQMGMKNGEAGIRTRGTDLLRTTV